MPLITCQNCGQKNPSDAVQCLHCNYRLLDPEEQSAEEARTFWLGLVGAGIILAVFGYIMINADYSSSTDDDGYYDDRRHSGGYYDSSGVYIVPVGSGGGYRSSGSSSYGSSRSMKRGSSSSYGSRTRSGSGGFGSGK